MRIEHEGISLWYGTSDAPAPSETIPENSDIAITVGVKPVDPSNRVDILYRINHGPVKTLPAQWLRNDPARKAQYFKAHLPALRAGDTVEYTAVCRCAGRQVPPPAEEAKRFSSFFRVTGTGAELIQAIAPKEPALPTAGTAAGSRTGVTSGGRAGMSFELHHTFVSQNFTPSRRRSEEETFFKVSEEGQFAVLYPGLLRRSASATFTHRISAPAEPDIIDGTPRPGTFQPLHGGVLSSTETILLQFRIFTPDGREFTATEVTLADLRKYRDLRGAPAGLWSYKLSGESKRFNLNLLEELDASITNAKGRVGIGVDETVRSESASPLIGNALVSAASQTFSFDLFRVGTFVAELSQASSPASWSATMRLIDPDGAVVARVEARTLRFPVGLATLGKSRDGAGKVRIWRLEVSPMLPLEVSPQGGVVVGTPLGVSPQGGVVVGTPLEVSPQGGVVVGTPLGVSPQGGVVVGTPPEVSPQVGPPRISATVIGSARLNTALLKGRIDRMLGPRGCFIELFGENKGGEALARLIITDPVAAETIDMHDLLVKTLSKTAQDGNADPENVQPNTLYTLGRLTENLRFGTTLEVKTLKVGAIDFAIGSGVRLGASVPAVRLTVEVSGKAKIKLGPATIAEAAVRGGKLEMEVGIKLGPDGTPQIVTCIRDDPFDLDLHWGVVLGLGLVSFGLIGFGATAANEYFESVLNEKVADGARELFDDPALAPSILMTILGAHLSYHPFRLEGDDIVFDHVAPLEPDPKPRPGYNGVIGRSMIDIGPGITTFIPPTLGNTWSAGNLAKIDHIVVVMMENRSYDHVLGYRSQGLLGDGADGLTSAVIASIEAADGGMHKVRQLRNAGFPANDLGFKTRIPKGVGHELDDVREQLSGRAPGPDNRQINSPKGFVENFLPRLATDPQGMVGDDVLGYYEATDLPFFAYLAGHYAYCDRYYCAHPGPTLPNRMYSLTGDVQYDRFGVPILDNNHGDNFLLSRAMTIYDLLTRKGLSWRVYESEPSVTMLRMFARYATNSTDIVPFDRLQADVASGNLPAFTAIEPAMHHHPQDDDHPDADMYRGQIFLKRVYDTLRSNPALWQKTMLIITYDEHGGLYDHVVPPVADLLEVPGLRDVAVATVAIANPDANAPAPARLSVPYGVRVPTFVVSPWAMRGKGPSITLDHCSIPKTVLARFLGGDKPFVSDRVHASQTFDAFLTEAQPRMNVPASPTLGALRIDVRRMAPGASAIVTPPLSRKAMREGPVDYHDLTGRLARMLGR